MRPANVFESYIKFDRPTNLIVSPFMRKCVVGALFGDDMIVDTHFFFNFQFMFFLNCITVVPHVCDHPFCNSRVATYEGWPLLRGFV